jgi:hypothetical protein
LGAGIEPEDDHESSDVSSNYDDSNKNESIIDGAERPDLDFTSQSPSAFHQR